MTFGKAILLGSVGLLIVTPALAQKSKDTLRIASNDPFPSLSQYHHPVAEAGVFYRKVYEQMISVDERKQKIVPMLAKSWKRINPTTLAFTLRDDIKFHNGNKFDADDVKYTLDYIRDPKVRLRFKGRYTWMTNIEKLGPYKIRITGKSVNAMDLGLVAYRMPIFDAETFKTHEKKSDYGRFTPVGTGSYKVVKIDNSGTRVTRFDAFKGSSKYWRSPIKNIHSVPVPDRQTQIAELLTGGVDMLRGISPDNAIAVAAKDGFEVTSLASGSFIFYGLDAIGRSGIKPLKDVRVRKAIWMALDRDKIIKHIVPGGGKAEKMQGLCFSHNTACSLNRKTVDYDLAHAKRLMKEAGYEKGFDMEYDVFTPIKEVGEAIAGELRKINIRVKINPVTIGVYRKRQGKSLQNSFSVYYPTAGHPDAGNILNVMFRGSRDHFKDKIIHDAMAEGLKEFDTAKRAAIYQRAFDRSNEMHYVMAFSSLPTVYAHSNTVQVKGSQLSAGDSHISDFFWK
jgi:peptide/nickel transport system substrate-binding protein